MNQITFELSAHKTTSNIRLKKAFTVSFATADDIEQSDYFGLVSGNDVPNKVERAGFTAKPSPNAIGNILFIFIGHSFPILPNLNHLAKALVQTLNKIDS